MFSLRISSSTFRLCHLNKSNRLSQCFFSTDRPETISGALKRFYLKVHPDLFTQYPIEKDVNEKSLQLVNAYLSSLQRKEHPVSMTVKFFTKIPTNLPPPSPVQLAPHQIHLNSKDLLTCVNTILNGLSLPVVDVPSSEKQTNRTELKFKIVEMDKNFDFTKIPKISIETWLISNTQVARSMAKRHANSLKTLHEKVQTIKDRFQLRSIDYSEDWSVSQFFACLTTFLTYADKWHERLLSLRGKRLIFGSKTSLLQDGSLELGANDPPVYWDHVICWELLELDQYLEKIASHEEHLTRYFRGIEICQDPDSEHLCRAHTYLHHLIHLNSHLDLNRDHPAHQTYSWKNFQLFVNPFSSEPSITNSGFFQINAYDATMDILDFMVGNRDKAKNARLLYEKDLQKENQLLEKLQNQFNLTDILTNPRLQKQNVIECCQRLITERQYFLNLLRKCRLKIDKHYNLAQNGTISIPWDWSFAQDETV